MSFADVVTQLNAITYAELASNAGYTHRMLTDGELPGLVLDMSRSFPFTEGAKIQNVLYTVGAATVICTHKLLVDSFAGGRVNETYLGDIVDHVDHYLDALFADITLNDNLLEPVTVLSIEIGEVLHGDIVYNGVKFMLKLVFRV